MERKKILLITVISACSFVVLVFAFSLIMALCYKEKIKMSQYKPPFETYTYEGTATERIYYETINGVKSTNMVYVYANEKGIVTKTKKNIKKYDEVLEIDYDVYYETGTLISSKMSELGYSYRDYDVEFSQTIYVVLKSKMTPVYMVDAYVDAEDKDIMIIINLSTGEYMNEADFTDLFDLGFFD